MRNRSRFRLPFLTSLGFVVAVLAILVLALLSWRAALARAQSDADVKQSVQVMEQLQGLLSAVKDAETGQRGYLLTAQEAYLKPYLDAQVRLPVERARLHALYDSEPGRKQILDALDRAIDEKMQELARTIELRRADAANAALGIVLSSRGRELMDTIREGVQELLGLEQQTLDQRARADLASAAFSNRVSLGGSAVLLLLVGIAAYMSARDFAHRETLVWIRAGQGEFATRIQGEQRLDQLGRLVLEFLTRYLGAQVGALFVAEQQGQGFLRVAAYGTDGLDARRREPVGLVAEALTQKRTLHVREVPDGYLPVVSNLGQSAPRELLIAPALIDGEVQAVLELGFFHTLNQAEREMLDCVCETLAVAVRSSRDRTRLELLLEETQRQGEELQTQQEELRVNNEELEEQGRALKESQARLESQQAELEQINSSLEEQTQMLEAQRDDLSRAQRGLNEKAAELERSNQYKSEFLANMSHELRTPLNSSLILSKLLADNRQGNLSEEQVKFAGTIHSAGNDLLTLINDILDLSRIEAGKMEVMSEAVTLAQTVADMQKTFEPVARQRGLDFCAWIEPGVIEHIHTDAQRLGQVLKNLLSNALKFTQRGQVSLRVFAQDMDTVSFSVTDTGIGIPADQLDAVFEAFRQADGSTQRRYGGSGLGLSISRDLAHLLGGTLGASSREGEGSVFTLTLPRVYRPAADAPAPLLAQVPPPREVPAGAMAEAARVPVSDSALTPIRVEDDRGTRAPGTRTILVIEDDERFAEILRDLARELGFACVITHSASEGLKAARGQRPQAIVLDMNLPDYSGLTVLEELKRDPATRHIPVHVASVADYTHQALERGAVGYALKPVKRDQLEQAFRLLEAKFTQGLRRVLVVEDDARMRASIGELLGGEEVQVTGAASAREALAQLAATRFDCVVMDLNLPDLSGIELLEKMAAQHDAADRAAFPPVIIYTGRELTRDEELRIRRFSKSIIVKDARSPERLLDEVTLFLHQVEEKLPLERQRMLQAARSREAGFEGRRILVVEDDARNIFALTSVLEPRGAVVEIARNGREGLEALERSTVEGRSGIDLVLMDIMMPEMDGITAMQEIRKRAEWKKLPIIALTAKAMKDDQDKCIAAGANDYIAKPLDVEKLLSLIRVWMRRG